MKTAKGYKLFRILKSQPGKLFPLYVYATEEIPIGEWLKAKEGQKTENGKTKWGKEEYEYRYEYVT